MNPEPKNETSLKDGEPCDHRGCLSHVTHPCEGCGRIGGVTGFHPVGAYPKTVRVDEIGAYR